MTPTDLTNNKYLFSVLGMVFIKYSENGFRCNKYLKKIKVKRSNLLKFNINIGI